MPNTATAAGIVADSRIVAASRIVYAVAVKAGMTVVPFPALLGRITIAVSVPPIGVMVARMAGIRIVIPVKATVVPGRIIIVTVGFPSWIIVVGRMRRHVMLVVVASLYARRMRVMMIRSVVMVMIRSIVMVMIRSIVMMGLGRRRRWRRRGYMVMVSITVVVAPRIPCIIPITVVAIARSPEEAIPNPVPTTAVKYII